MDYSSHNSRGRRQSEGRSSGLARLLLATLIMLLMSASAFLIYEYKTHPEWVDEIAQYRVRVGIWLAERKQGMHHGIARVKNQIVVREDDDRVVNFEFYSTLQEMKSMEAQARDDAEQKLVERSATVPSAKNSILKKSQDRNAKTLIAKKHDDAVSSIKKIKQIKISHAEDLENDLLATMKQNDRGR
jgi:hypothetical protein